MENDSLQAAETPDNGAVTDFSEVQMPTAEQLGISISAGAKDASGAVMPLSAYVGDTIDFPVTVSWNIKGSVLPVVPANSATANGLSQVSVSQESARSIKDGKELASITFNYKIAVKDTGNLTIPVLKYEIPTPMGRPLELRTESVALRSDEPQNMLPFIAGGVMALIVLIASVCFMKRGAARRTAMAARKSAEKDLMDRMLVLKQRVMVADSRQWLLELECIAKDYVSMHLELSTKASDMNLDSLLQSGKLEKLGSKDVWKNLLDEFAHARYGGGKRDCFENKETWKQAMKLMGMDEE